MQADLVERAQNGDREAFGRLAAAEIDRLHAIARLVLRDADLAEDAVQNALVRCWRKLPTLRDTERFDAWLSRILMNAIADEWRRRKRFLETVAVVGGEPSTSDASRAVADRDELEHGFRRLSLDHRAIIVLRHFADLPLHEAADALGIPVGTAKSRYHHAMAALRAALEADARLAARREATA